MSLIRFQNINNYFEGSISWVCPKPAKNGIKPKMRQKTDVSEIISFEAITYDLWNSLNLWNSLRDNILSFNIIVLWIHEISQKTLYESMK